MNNRTLACAAKRNRIVFIVGVLLLAIGVSMPRFISAQSAPEPQREQLLNGLNVLLLPRPGDQIVRMTLRVRSGAAFDLAGKEGTMALLGDALFPDAATREFITEELGGSLDVTTGYDSINVTLTGRASEFERLVELLRNALVNTPLTVETLAQVRAARVRVASETGVAPEAIADRALFARLFRTYPYARTASGVPESLRRIERADLLLARERFLNPNNSTLTVIGGVERGRAMRALRQLLGGWRRSDRLVPSTFRQPDAPDARPLIVNLAGAASAEIRVAARGLARSDRDRAAANLLALIMRDRWRAAVGLERNNLFARHDAYALSGAFVMGASVPPASAGRALETARAVVNALAATAPSAEELEAARTELNAARNIETTQPDWLAASWLDAEMYRTTYTDETRRIMSATPGDIQRVAARLFTGTPLATVAVGDGAQLRAELSRLGAVEEQTAQIPPPTSPAPSAPRPAASPQVRQ